MPKRKPQKKKQQDEGVALCLAHPDGRVACHKTGKLLRGYTNDSGYRAVVIQQKMFLVSRIIALAFLVQKRSLITLAAFLLLEIDHGTGGKLCNAVSNLKALAISAHKSLTTKRCKAAGNPWTKKSGDTRGAPCEFREFGSSVWIRVVSRAEASRRTGVAYSTLCNKLNSETAIATGERARWLDDGVHYGRTDHDGIEFRDVAMSVEDEGEAWARAPAPYDDFEVSDQGRVRDAKKKRVRTPSMSGDGRYARMIIKGNPIYVHNLVMLTWVGLPPIDKPVQHGVWLMVASTPSTQRGHVATQVVLHNPETGSLDNKLKHLRYGSVAENNAERAAPTKPKDGDPVKWRLVALKPGPWTVEVSRTQAGVATGLSSWTVGRAMRDGKARLGKGGKYYEFVDASVPDDIKDFVVVRVLPEHLERGVPGHVFNAYLGRTFLDKKTKERFTVCDVWNNYELKNVDHSQRLCLWFYDTAQYKKTPDEEHWEWCQVASMSANGYEFVDDGVSARAVISKKRARSEPDSSDSESDSEDDAPWHTLPEAVRMRAELAARLADLDDPFVGHEDFIQL